mmetsp:Transcript_34344/g.80144  ORF Transcript_34344/g.80144 Transcript_34344/m.80144 type:complete len:437 (-) Transcript_34344:18-1328(-)
MQNATPAGVAYQPGQGLDRKALQRLLDRKGASQGILKELPAEDRSKQWEGLIGSGKKKLRCSQCTRPIEPDDVTARQLICGRCSAGVPADPRGKDQRHRKSLALDSCVDETSQAQELCRTPSTEANSEELTASQPPTPQDVDLTSLKQQLAGEWLGRQGCKYQVVFGDLHDIRVTRVHQDSPAQPDVPLYLDIRERFMWWGKDRLYFLDLSEVDWMSEPASLVWRDPGCGQRPDMEWQRPTHERNDSSGSQVRVQRWARRTPLQTGEDVAQEPASMPTPADSVPAQSASSPQDVEAKPRQPKAQTSSRAVWKPVVRADSTDKALEGEAKLWKLQQTALAGVPDESRKAAADRKDELAEEALREIISQLKRPGNGGYVWVDDWNERFNATLGTVRNFIESKPDKFQVTPTTGRGYRVMLVTETRPSKPVWRKLRGGS